MLGPSSEGYAADKMAAPGRSDLRYERHTERLVLVPWNASFLADFTALCSDRRAMQFITGGRPISPEDARGLSDKSIRLWDEYGIGPWAALDTSTGAWVGRIGLNHLDWWPDEHKWEIGFELSPSYWGRGLATEGAREGVRAGFEEAGLPRIISVTHPDHRASRHVMEKCGLAFQGERSFEDGKVRVVWYALDRADFERISSTPALTST